MPVKEKIRIFVARQIDTRHRITQSSLPVLFGAQQEDLESNDVDLTLKVLLDNLQRNSIHLAEYNRDVYYEREPLIFICIGVRPYYVDIPNLSINWKNETSTQVKIAKRRRKIGSKMIKRFLYLRNNTDMFDGIGSDSVSVFGKTVKATKDMGSIDCWMPVEGSSEFDKISKKLTILPSVAPKFKEPLLETVYLYIGEKNNVVTCTVIEAVPPAKVAVLRDGKNVALNYNYKKKNRTEDVKDPGKGFTISLDFSTIEYIHQGQLECIAKNVNQTTRRIVHVFVIGTFKAYLFDI